MALMMTVVCGAGQESQTDWSGGPANASPVNAFGEGFVSSQNISWLAVPGQIVLSSTALESPVRFSFANEGTNGAYGLASVDIDDDGDADLLGTSDAQRGILLWTNEGGDPPVLQRHVIDSDYPGGTSLHAADVDHDGDLDLVGAAQTPGNEVSWWRNNSETDEPWERFDVDGFFPVACNVFAADVDGDGWTDVLSTSWTQGRLNMWRHSGTDPVEWTEQTLATGLRGAHSAVAGDMDGDGDQDVVGTGANDREVILLRNLGGDPIEWGEEVIGDDLGGVRYAAVGDIDGDGMLDIVAAAADGKVVWWRNLGAGETWQRNVIDQSCLGGHWVVVKDIDGDGRRDVVVAAYVAGRYFWYRNPGDGETWTRHDVGQMAYSSPLTVIAADLDGRGDLELIGSEWEPGAFYWWEVSEFVSSGELVSAVVDLGPSAAGLRLSWRVDQPAGTHLRMEVRTGTSPELLGNWQEIEGEDDVIELSGSLVQYRVTLSTGDPAVSPILREVNVIRILRGVESSDHELIEPVSL